MSYKLGNDKYFKFAGKNSIDFLCFASQGDMFSIPEKKGTFTTVSGRPRDLYLDEEGFNNKTRTFECFIPDNKFKQRYQQLMAFLLSNNGYQKIEWGAQPELFSYAVFLGGTEPSVVRGGKGATFDLEFNFDPRKFYKQGQYETALYDSSTISGTVLETMNTIRNETLFKAKPLIFLKGTKSTAESILKINDTVITVAKGNTDFVSNGFYIDSENMNCYNTQKVNVNDQVSINWKSEEPYPILHPGDNAIELTNATGNITPRTWTI